jgi:hypothetical protein
VDEDAKTGTRNDRVPDISPDPPIASEALGSPGQRPRPAGVPPQISLEGRMRLLLLYDVGEQIDLNRIQQILGPRSMPIDALLGPQKTAPYIRFNQAPLTQKLDTKLSLDGREADLAARYYGFGVIVLQIEIPFRCNWLGVEERFSSLLEAPAQLELKLKDILEDLRESVAPAIIRPAQKWLSERYAIVNVLRISDDSGRDFGPEEVKSRFGEQLAALLRGETAALAREETEDVLSASLSYYQSDLTIITSAAAFVYDRPDEAAVENYILEYARIQLLEFRYYDALLENLLDNLYDTLGRQRNAIFARWSIPRDANRFNRIRIDAMELRERVVNAVKFVSDAFYAKMYRLAALRMGVTEYRELVDEKLETAAGLHEFMTDQFNEARTFVLEVIAAVLALIDVVFLIRGR